jgi:hypothetical protein
MATPASRYELLERGSGVRIASRVAGHLAGGQRTLQHPRATLFLHKGVPVADVKAPTVQVICTRESGLTLTSPYDVNRVGLTETISLTNVKSIGYGMGIKSYRAWREWREYVQKKSEKGQKKTSNAPPPESSPISEDGVSRFGGAADSNHQFETSHLFARRTITVHLRAPQSLVMFSVWAKEVTLIFHSLDDLNAFLVAISDALNFVLWSVDAVSLFEPQQQDEAPESGSMSSSLGLPDGRFLSEKESALCTMWRMSMIEFAAMKARVTDPKAPKIIRIFEDLMKIAPTSDYLQIALAVAHFEVCGWISTQTVYRCL